MAFKLPFTSRSAANQSSGDIEKYGLQFFGFRVYLPFFSRYSFDRQVRILGVTTLTFLLAALALSFLERQAANALSAQASRTSDLQAHWQRLEKNAQLANFYGGNPVFDALHHARSQFFSTLSLLERSEAELPVAADDTRSSLDNLLAESAHLGKLLDRIEAGRPLQESLGHANEMRDNLLLISDSTVAGVAPLLAQKVQQLQLMLVQITSAVQALQTSGSAKALDALSARLDAVRTVLAQLPASNPAVAGLAEGFDSYQKVLGFILSNRDYSLVAR